MASLPRAALHDVVTERVGEDVVAVAADRVVVAGAAFDAVVAAVAAERVVAYARDDAVAVDRAVPDDVRAAEDSGSVPFGMRTSSPVANNSASSSGVVGIVLRVTLVVSQVRDVQNEVRPSEDVAARARQRRVARDQLGERVAFDLREQVQAVETLQVVEAVGVLQVLQLDARTRS